MQNQVKMVELKIIFSSEKFWNHENQGIKQNALNIEKTVSLLYHKVLNQEFVKVTKYIQLVRFY